MKNIFQKIDIWHQEIVDCQTSKQELCSIPLILEKATEKVDSEKKAAQLLSFLLKKEVVVEDLLWAVPFSLKIRKGEWHLSPGYALPFNDQGWIFIWKYSNEIIFLDNITFGVETIFSYKKEKFRAQMDKKNIYIRAFLILIMSLIVLLLAGLCS